VGERIKVRGHTIVPDGKQDQGGKAQPVGQMKAAEVKM